MEYFRVPNSWQIGEIQLGNPEVDASYLWKIQIAQQNQDLLDDCIDEAFNMRSIPFAMVFALGAHKAVAKGYVKPTRLLGSLPWILGSSMLGCFVGLYSYRNKCAEKFQMSNNETLRDLLRADAMQKEENIEEQKFVKPNSLDLDTQRSYVTDIDDFRLNMDDRLFKSIARRQSLIPTPVTYAELRQKNRENYAELRRKNRESYDRVMNEM